MAKAAGELKGEVGSGRKTTVSSKATVDYLQLLISELAGSGMVVLIDDFHYIPRDIQTLVAQQIKEAIDKGVKIICASVPYHSEDVLRGNADLRGRIVSLNFNYWDVGQLAKIGELGFAALNIDASAGTIKLFAAEAAGSPQLMQAICLNACYAVDCRTRPEQSRTLPNDSDFLTEVCSRISPSADFSSTLEKLIEGPKTRGTERNSYIMENGSVGDVYTVILRAIAASPPTLHFLYSTLQDRIAQICTGAAPSGSSVTGHAIRSHNLRTTARAGSYWSGIPKATF